MAEKTKTVENEGMEVDEDVELVTQAKQIDISQEMPELLRKNVTTLQRAVELDDKNLIRRVWRRNTPLRKGLSLYDFQQVLVETFPKGNLLKNLISLLDQAIKEFETRNSGVGKNRKESPRETKVKEAVEEPLMEVEAYLTLFLISKLVEFGVFEVSLEACKQLIEKLKLLKRQTLDSFVAKTYFFYSLSSEKLFIASTKVEGKNAVDRSLALAAHYKNELLNDLLNGQKSAALRLYEESQATLINLVLRKYIAEKEYSQARMFITATAEVPLLDSSNVGNNQQIRYLYYVGKVAAVEANYSESDLNVTRAIRKCPTDTGVGFRLTINKLSVVVKLLMGEVPERSLFHEKDMSKELEPYFHLVKSVRNGSVAEYDKVSASFAKVFERDDLLTLIERLRSSVIKTGLRNISLAYSRISFKDIMEKLELKTEKDAELVCAKAIRDEIIENAVVDSKTKTLISTETIDVYSTTLEPREQFSNRVDFCLGVHNAALKAHKYPPNSHKPQNEEKNDQSELEDVIAAFQDLLE